MACPKCELMACLQSMTIKSQGDDVGHLVMGESMVKYIEKVIISKAVKKWPIFDTSRKK